jgi:hypothetical protein
MAATVTRDFMFKQMEDNNLPYFQVYGADRTLISDNMEIADLEESRNMLDEVLNSVMDSSVIVCLSKRTRREMGSGGNVKTGYREYKIILRAATAGVGGIGSQSMVQDLMAENKALNEKLHQKDIELMRKELQDQIDDLKKEDPMDKLALQAITGIFGNKEQPMAGVGIAGNANETINEKELARQKKIKAALVRLAKVDPKIDETLTMFADWAEKNPEKYPLLILQMK